MRIRLLALAVTILSPLAATASSPRHVNLNPPLTWAWSGVWGLPGCNPDAIVIGNAVVEEWSSERKSVLTDFRVYDISGQLVETFNVDNTMTIQPSYERTERFIDAGRGGFFRVRCVNASYQPSYRVVLSPDVVEKEFAAFQAVGLPGERFLSFGDVREGKDRNNLSSWKSGLMAVDLSNPDGWRYTLLDEFPVETRPKSTFTLYLRGYPYLAVNRGKGYFLAMNDFFASIVEVWWDESGEPRTRTLPVFPPGYQIPSLTFLDACLNQNRIALQYQELARSTMPTGLYAGSDNNIYIVTREANSSYSIWGINPAADTLWHAYTVSVPAETDHLVVIPGPQWWAFVLVPQIQGFSNHSISSMLIVETKDIEKKL